MRALVVATLLLAVPAIATAQRDVAAKHYEQGEAYMKTEQYALAAAEFEKAYAAVPNAGFLFNIGLAYEQAGEAKKAAENYRRYIADEPSGQKVEEARARAAKLESDLVAAEERRKHEEAKRAEQEVLRERVEGILEEAKQKRTAGDYTGAIVALRTAHGLTQDPERLFDIAELHREDGNAAEAKVFFDSYIAAAPTGARHIEARRHIDTITAEIAAAAAPPTAPVKPPGPWSGGFKVGTQKATASASNRSDSTCIHEPVLGLTVTGFISYRLNDRAFVQGEGLISYRPVEMDCGPEFSSDVDTLAVEVPVVVGAYLVRHHNVYAAAYAGAAITAPADLANDRLQETGVSATALVGAEAGVGIAGGALLFDLRLSLNSAEYTWFDNGRSVDFDSTVTIAGLVGFRFGDRAR